VLSISGPSASAGTTPCPISVEDKEKQTGHELSSNPKALPIAAKLLTAQGCFRVAKQARPYHQHVDIKHVILPYRLPTRVLRATEGAKSATRCGKSIAGWPGPAGNRDRDRDRDNFANCKSFKEVRYNAYPRPNQV
jgi:hypothetical protein